MSSSPTILEPHIEQTTLSNGLVIITGLMPNVRSASINVYVKVGSRYEREEVSGISHVVEHMVFKGTPTRPSHLDISGEIEGVGGIINASTEEELTVYWCKVGSSYLERSVTLLIDMVRNSVFHSEELARELLVVIEEQRMVNDQPSYKVDSVLDTMMWPNHPLGRDIAGTKETVMSLSRDKILDHVQAHYVPSNLVVSVAGDVNHKRIVELLERLTEGWPTKPRKSWKPFVNHQEAPQMKLEVSKTEQTHLALGLPGYSIDHPDRYVIALLSVILGEGMSSRLFIELRENRGLAYDIGSSVCNFLDCGAFTISAGVNPKNIYLSISTICDEIVRLRDPIPEQEIDKAKRMAEGRLALKMEDSQEVSSWIGSQMVFLDEVKPFSDVVNNIHSITSDELSRVAEELAKSKKANLAIVGPKEGKRQIKTLLNF